jgi:hypothetical protein
MACITGSISGAYEGMDNDISQKTMSLLDDDLQNVVIEFHQKYIPEHKLERAEYAGMDAIRERTNTQYYAPPVERSFFSRLFG